MNEHHTLYDKILTELPKDGFHNGNPDLYHHVDLQYLASKGFIDLQYAEGGKIFSFGITGKGVEFISEGGFAESARAKEISDFDANLQRENWLATTKSAKRATIISWISLGISIIATAVAIIALK